MKPASWRRNPPEQCPQEQLLEADAGAGDRLTLVSLLSARRGVHEMTAAQGRLELLCRRSGGIFFYKDRELQRDILGIGIKDRDDQKIPSPTLSRKQINVLIKKGSMTLVRFRCTESVFGFMRGGFNRYPPEQMRLSGPRPEDSWTFPDDKGIEQLQPCLDENESHPYPVEFILPSWTIDSNDFRSWLFSFGNRIQIEAPESLRTKHQEFGAGIAALYPASVTEPRG